MHSTRFSLVRRLTGPLLAAVLAAGTLTLAASPARAEGTTKFAVIDVRRAVLETEQGLRVQAQLKEHGLTLDVRDDAHAMLAQRGYDPAFGARPLRRIITNLIEDPLSEGVLEGRFRTGDIVVVDTATLENGETYLRLRPQREVDAEVEEPAGAVA